MAEPSAVDVWRGTRSVLGGMGRLRRLAVGDRRGVGVLGAMVDAKVMASSVVGRIPAQCVATGRCKIRDAQADWWNLGDMGDMPGYGRVNHRVERRQRDPERS